MKAQLALKLLHEYLKVNESLTMGETLVAVPLEIILQLEEAHDELSDPEAGNLFWDFDNTEESYESVNEIMDYQDLNTVVRINRAAHLPDVYAVRTFSEVEDDYIEKHFYTEEEAKAWLASRSGTW